MEIWQYNYGPVRGDELYHHGIKGQKWGIRRYQNEDGSLTDAGKKRYIGTGKRDRKYDMTADVRSRIRSAKGDTDKAISGVRKDAKKVQDHYDKQFDISDKIMKGRNLVGLTAGGLASAGILGASTTVPGAALGVASVLGTVGLYTLSEVVRTNQAVSNRKYVYDNINRYADQTIEDIKSRAGR